MYRQDFRNAVIVAPDGSRSDQGNVSMAGISTGYGYPLGLLMGQE
jgi:hypothetical protein